MSVNKGKLKLDFSSFSNTYSDDYYGHTPAAHYYLTRIHRVEELIGKPKHLRFLDVGCGPGFISTYVTECESNYYGLDISKEMLYQVTERKEKSSQVFLFQGSMDYLPFKDSSFDVVLCLGALEYADNPGWVLSELSRVARKRGVVIVSMLNKWSVYRFWNSKIYDSKFAIWLKNIFRSKTEKQIIEKMYPMPLLKKLFTKNHLQVIESEYYDFNCFLTPLDRIFPDLCVSLSNILEPLYHNKLGTLLATAYLMEGIKLG